jgi:hypothetical protein
MERDPSEAPRPSHAPRPARPVSRPRPASSGSALLDRAVAVVTTIARAILRLGALALLAGIAIWWAVFREAEDAGAIGLTLVAIIVLAPPVILFLFATALRALAALPRRLRETPGAVGDRVAQVRSRVAEIGEARRRGFVASIRSLFRLGWSVASSREVLELSPALVLLTPGMLMASLVAAGAALLEILAGAIAVLVLLLS